MTAFFWPGSIWLGSWMWTSGQRHSVGSDLRTLISFGRVLDQFDWPTLATIYDCSDRYSKTVNYVSSSVLD